LTLTCNHGKTNSSRMKKTHYLLLILCAGTIAGCGVTPRRPAPVVDMATQSGTSRVSGEGAANGRAVDERGYYTVRRGDTLLRIAQEFGQSTRDLISWNNLTNPNDIRVDQVLRVAPPSGTAQASSVTSGSGVEIRPLNGAAAGVPSPSVGTKTAPRGDKRAYSEAALAELQKPDGVAPATSASPPGAPAIHPDQSKPSDKAVAPLSTDDSNIVFIWPAEGKITGTFDGGKKGIDIAGKSGQPVIAAAAGKVMYAGSGIRGYGNLVIVKHSNNLLSAYAHNKSIVVKEGQNVAKGEKIAEMGNSDSDSVKLHFEIRQQGKPVDPSKFLPAK
jgi:lipoprotein NlpD